VLNSAVAARLLRRGGPAAGHRSDPDWRPPEDGDQEVDEGPDENPADGEPSETGSTVLTAEVGAASEQTELNYLDVDVVDEDPAAVTLEATDEKAGDSSGAADVDEEVASDPAASDMAAEADEYEYVEDTSGLEAEEEPPNTMSPVAAPSASRRQRYDSKTAGAVTARKYEFRKRVLTVMAVIMAVSAAVAYTVAPTAWWVCGGAAGVTLLYLAYLRRQTRIEERVRARRMQRMARGRLGVENTSDREFDVVPARLRRPGAAVLEIDEEDPVFEHLEYVPFARAYDWRHDLPRAAGQ
jgi:uncharacterized membrane protein